MPIHFSIILNFSVKYFLAFRCFRNNKLNNGEITSWVFDFKWTATVIFYFNDVTVVFNLIKIFVSEVPTNSYSDGSESELRTKSKIHSFVAFRQISAKTLFFADIFVISPPYQKTIPKDSFCSFKAFYNSVSAF